MCVHTVRAYFHRDRGVWLVRARFFLEENMWDFTFFLHSVVFGISLAADAFSVSLANGLNEQNMRKSKMMGVAGVFAFFQA